jgi:hypothetical protein
MKTDLSDLTFGPLQLQCPPAKTTLTITVAIILPAGKTLQQFDFFCAAVP